MKPICELLVVLGEHDRSRVNVALPLVEGTALLAMSTVAKGLVLRTAVARPDVLDLQTQGFVILET